MQNIVMLNNFFHLFFQRTPLDKQFFHFFYILCKKTSNSYQIFIYHWAFGILRCRTTFFLWMFCFSKAYQVMSFSHKKTNFFTIFLLKKIFSHLSKNIASLSCPKKFFFSVPFFFRLFTQKWEKNVQVDNFFYYYFFFQSYYLIRFRFWDYIIYLNILLIMNSNSVVVVIVGGGCFFFMKDENSYFLQMRQYVISLSSPHEKNIQEFLNNLHMS